jgi:hypothetical protein
LRSVGLTTAVRQNALLAVLQLDPKAAMYTGLGALAYLRRCDHFQSFPVLQVRVFR